MAAEANAGGPGAPIRLGTAVISSQVEAGPDQHVLTLQAPWLLPAVPGQFVHIACGDNRRQLLRRPISIFRSGAAPGEGDGERISCGSPLALGEVSLFYRVVGSGTGWLAERQAGEELSLIGPLGSGFRLGEECRLLLVAGGIGVAPLVMLAEQAASEGREVRLLAGAQTAEQLLPAAQMPSCINYETISDDGSSGRAGLVTDLLTSHLGWAEALFACGPTTMLAALEAVRRQRPALPIQVSLEERMACGVGACFGCVVQTRRGPLRVCSEGPVFDFDEVVWS